MAHLRLRAVCLTCALNLTRGQTNCILSHECRSSRQVVDLNQRIFVIIFSGASSVTALAQSDKFHPQNKI